MIGQSSSRPAVSTRRPGLAVAGAYGTVALAFSGQWIVGKLGVAAVPPLELSAIRFAVVGAALVAICALRRTRLPIDRWRLVAVAAAFGILGFNALAFVGLTMTPASDAALIVPTTIPALTGLFSVLIGERLTPGKIVGFSIASAGAAIVIIAGQGTGAPFSERRLLGDMLLLAGAASWAAYVTIGAVALRTASPLGLVALSSCFGAAMLFPFGFLEHGYRDVPSWRIESWLAVAYLVVVATIVGYVLIFWAVHRFGAGLGSMVSYLVPLATLLLAFAILGERPQTLQMFGGAVILIGVRVATRRPRATAGRGLPASF